MNGRSANPIAFARVEVDRCIETIRVTAMELVAMNGETIPTDIAPSGKEAIAYYNAEFLPVLSPV